MREERLGRARLLPSFCVGANGSIDEKLGRSLALPESKMTNR